MACNKEEAVLGVSMFNWDDSEEIFPQLTEDVRLKQWGERCILVNHWTGRQFQVSVLEAFALSLCYGHFSLAQILDLVSYAFQVSLAQAKEEIKPIFEKFLRGEMFAVGPLANAGRKEPLCEPALILNEAMRGQTPVGRRQPAPMFLVMVLTEKCDMRCIYCFRNAGEGSNLELVTEDWLKVIEQAAEAGVVRCFVTGGEPTLHKGFVPIVSSLLNHGIYPYISTNALHLNDETIEKLINSGLRRIQVSFDAANESLFYQMTGIQTGFENVLNNIRRLSDAGIEVMVKSVVIPLNYRFVRQVVKTCVDLGVRIVSFEPYGNAPYGRSGKELLLSDEQRREALSELKIAEKEFGVRVIVMGKSLEKTEQWKKLPQDCTICGGFVSSIVIQSNGDVGPCELLPTVKALRIGNIREISLKDLWNSPEAERIANPPREHLEEACVNCEHFNYCRGGCHAYALLYSSNPFAPDPHCPRVKIAQNPVLV